MWSIHKVTGIVLGFLLNAILIRRAAIDYRCITLIHQNLNYTNNNIAYLLKMNKKVTWVSGVVINKYKCICYLSSKLLTNMWLLTCVNLWTWERERGRGHKKENGDIITIEWKQLFFFLNSQINQVQHERVCCMKKYKLHILLV